MSAADSNPLMLQTLLAIRAISISPSTVTTHRVRAHRSSGCGQLPQSPRRSTTCHPCAVRRTCSAGRRGSNARYWRSSRRHPGGLWPASGQFRRRSRQRGAHRGRRRNLGGGANCTAPGQSRPMMPRSTKGLLGEMPASAATCLLAAGSSGKSPQR